VPYGVSGSSVVSGSPVADVAAAAIAVASSPSEVAGEATEEADLDVVEETEDAELDSFAAENETFIRQRRMPAMPARLRDYECT